MVRDMEPASGRRLGAQGLFLRRRRIFARLREGWSYEEMGMTAARIRQKQAAIVDASNGHPLARLSHNLKGERRRWGNSFV
jgi:hypothetical protein